MTFATTTDHVAVNVSDLDRSLAFYCGLLGLREVERHRLEGDGISQMTGKPGTVMQVVRLQAPDTPGVLIDLQQYIALPGGPSDSKLGDVANTPTSASAQRGCRTRTRRCRPAAWSSCPNRSPSSSRPARSTSS